MKRAGCARVACQTRSGFSTYQTSNTEAGVRKVMPFLQNLYAGKRSFDAAITVEDQQ
ncbi:hypothetical protein SAMN05414139_08386 [Burkholderia sp. D7]|nr:hypothetical protein SAMN05414139_08386 [Burkholderia sp. D7]